MPTITLTAGQLDRLCERALRFVHAYDDIPVLATVQLRVEGHVVTATATDRYVLGRSRVQLAEDHPLHKAEVLIPAADLRIVLDLFRLAKDQDEDSPAVNTLPVATPVELAISDTAVTFTGGGRSYAAQLPTDTGRFPDVDALIAPFLKRALAGEPATSSIGLDPRLLTKFAHLGTYCDQPVQVYLPGEPTKPILVTAPDFIGLQMPVKISADAPCRVEQWTSNTLPAAGVEPLEDQLVPTAAVLPPVGTELTGMDYIAAFGGWPTKRQKVTAEVLLRNLLATCQLHSSLASIESPFDSSEKERETPEYRKAMQLYGARIHNVVADFSTAFLLRTLMRMAPEAAETAARELWEHLEDGDTVGELSWEWLEALGLDPDRAGKPAVISGELAPVHTKIVADEDLVPPNPVEVSG